MNDQPTEAVAPEIDRMLRVAVERVVRPVVATEVRKLKMRRELHTHALDAYAAEVASGRDPKRSAAEAIRRLGEPDEITRELQAGVPASSRREAQLDRWLRRDPSTPRPRHAAFVGAVMGVALFLFIMLVLAVCEAIDLGKNADRLAFRFSIWLSALFGWGTAVGSWFGGKIRDTLAIDAVSRRGVVRATLFAAGGFVTLFVVGLLMLVTLLASEQGGEGLRRVVGEIPVAFLWSWCGVCTVIALGAGPIAWFDVRERAGLREWTTLELE